jgi:hypothetical protein
VRRNIGKYTLLGLIIVLKTSFSVQIDEARQGLREIRSELDAIKQIVAIRRREKAYWDIKYRLAALQFEKALIKHAYACLKGGFRPDQPRWPKRTPQGGRWSGGAGAEPPQTGPSRNPRSRGHHFIPGELYRREPLKPETRKVFEDAVTGPLRGQQHGNSEEHQNYSRAVREAFDRFKSRNGIVRPEDMTPERAKKFVDEVRDSKDPRIHNFNMKIYMREIRFYLRRIPRRIE